MSENLVWNFKLNQSISSPLKLFKVCTTDTIKWEARFFWPEDEDIFLNAIDETLLDLNHYKHKYKDDFYYLLPDNDYNIKLRRNKLLYKPLIKQTPFASGFGSKIDLENVENNSRHLHDLKTQVLEKGEIIPIKKESFTFKFPTTPSVKLELARLELANQIFFSACIEGRSLELVEIIGKLLLSQEISCDYVSFLKTITKL